MYVRMTDNKGFLAIYGHRDNVLINNMPYREIKILETKMITSVEPEQAEQILEIFYTENKESQEDYICRAVIVEKSTLTGATCSISSIYPPLPLLSPTSNKKDLFFLWSTMLPWKHAVRVSTAFLVLVLP